MTPAYERMRRRLLCSGARLDHPDLNVSWFYLGGGIESTRVPRASWNDDLHSVNHFPPDSRRQRSNSHRNCCQVQNKGWGVGS